MELREHFFVVGNEYKITIDLKKVPVWSNKELIKDEYIGILKFIPCVKIGSYAGIIIKEIKDLEDLSDLPKHDNGNDNRIVQLIMCVNNEEKSFIFNGPLPNSYVISINKNE
jgi:hypothetical protein